MPTIADVDAILSDTIFLGVVDGSGVEGLLLGGWLAAILDGEDIEDAGEDEGDDGSEAPPVSEEDHECDGGGGEDGAEKVENARDPVDTGRLKAVRHDSTLSAFSEPSCKHPRHPRAFRLALRSDIKNDISQLAILSQAPQILEHGCIADIVADVPRRKIPHNLLP